MKTTLEILDALFQRAKSAAAEQGIPFRELVSEALAESCAFRDAKTSRGSKRSANFVVCAKSRPASAAQSNKSSAASNHGIGSDPGHQRTVSHGGWRHEVGAPTSTSTRAGSAGNCAGRVSIRHPALASSDAVRIVANRTPHHLPRAGRR